MKEVHTRREYEDYRGFEVRRNMVTLSEAATALNVSREAIHWHIRNSPIYVESIGEVEGRKAALYRVDLRELEQIVKGGKEEESDND